MENTMFELADRLKQLRAEKKDHEEMAKQLGADAEEIEQKLVASMVEEEMQNFNRSGMLFYLNTKTYASAVPEKKQDLFQSLKDNGFGDLVQEQVNSQSLTAFVKEQMEDNEEMLPDWLDGLVSTFEKTTIGMRRSK